LIETDADWNSMAEQAKNRKQVIYRERVARKPAPPLRALVAPSQVLCVPTCQF